MLRDSRYSMLLTSSMEPAESSLLSHSIRLPPPIVRSSLDRDLQSLRRLRCDVRVDVWVGMNGVLVTEPRRKRLKRVVGSAAGKRALKDNGTQFSELEHRDHAIQTVFAAKALDRLAVLKAVDVVVNELLICEVEVEFTQVLAFEHELDIVVGSIGGESSVRVAREVWKRKSMDRLECRLERRLAANGDVDRSEPLLELGVSWATMDFEDGLFDLDQNRLHSQLPVSCVSELGDWNGCWWHSVEASPEENWHGLLVANVG